MGARAVAERGEAPMGKQGEGAERKPAEEERPGGGRCCAHTRSRHSHINTRLGEKGGRAHYKLGGEYRAALSPVILLLFKPVPPDDDQEIAVFRYPLPPFAE